MKIEEFRNRYEEEEDWAPGWEEIEKEFERIYPNQEPEHYGITFTARASLGGDEFLDGYSYYKSKKEYLHVVSYGMSQLYYEEEAFGGEYSGWGYEMTMKTKESIENSKWIMELMSHLAKYTYSSESYFEPFQYIEIDVRVLAKNPRSKIKGFLIVPDTEVNTLKGVYGELQFLQLVSITEKELEVLKKDRTKSEKLYNLMKEDNEDLIIDFSRTKDYL